MFHLKKEVTRKPPALGKDLGLKNNMWRLALLSKWKAKTH